MSSNNSISNFKNAFGGGTRANRFEVTGIFPTASDFGVGPVSVGANETKFKIFATSMPKAELGTIQVPYRGRLLNFAGDRSYGNWAVSIYDDNNTNNLWKAFNTWKELLDGHLTHQVANSDFDYSTLQRDWTVKQLPLNGQPSGTTPLRQITLKNCWPSQISSMDFDMAKADQTIFNVVLTFDWYSIDTGI
jgi:hypothetical protein